MLDIYFKRALLIDYAISTIISIGVYFLYHKYGFVIPDKEVLLSLTGDLSTISLTFAGFILTLLTILITFKAGARIPTDETQHIVPLFDIFFSTPLYFKTINLLKNAIKSLIGIAMVGYLLKLTLIGNHVFNLFYFDILSISVITITLFRNLKILSLILALQNRTPNEN
jgi:hypothetical protein